MSGFKRVLGKRPSEEQKSALINFLELHVDLANDKFESVDGSRLRRELWKECATNLNALGGAGKDGGKWRKFWMDLRSYTKERLSRSKELLNKSGVNGTKIMKPLTEFDQRVVALITPQSIEGDINIAELGFGAPTSKEPIPMEFVVDHEEPDKESRPQDCEPIEVEQLTDHDKTVKESRSQRQRRTKKPQTNYEEALLEIEREKISLEKQKLNLKRRKLELIEKQTEQLAAIGETVKKNLNKM